MLASGTSAAEQIAAQQSALIAARYEELRRIRVGLPNAAARLAPVATGALAFSPANGQAMPGAMPTVNPLAANAAAVGALPQEEIMRRAQADNAVHMYQNYLAGLVRGGGRGKAQKAQAAQARWNYSQFIRAKADAIVRGQRFELNQVQGMSVGYYAPPAPTAVTTDSPRPAVPAAPLPAFTKQYAAGPAGLHGVPQAGPSNIANANSNHAPFIDMKSGVDGKPFQHRMRSSSFSDSDRDETLHNDLTGVMRDGFPDWDRTAVEYDILGRGESRYGRAMGFEGQ